MIWKLVLRKTAPVDAPDTLSGVRGDKDYQRSSE